eukprot:CAMPEP_0170624538 /NCGR_PEP_ID=MMETSP0224-20130122/30284_1 /TAXON_ID=285029 /ORGANISM="Togula jolla, Strain CCCM 725" /LENGTH=220 /DNA_ID=CAMNT_0010951063 /DNA_START=102 /DNA_END=761 /DNA_ORIENTATION=-
MNPDFKEFPDLKGALCYETVLGPGELLFVPEGWTHEVFNLEDSVSTSSNFVDDDNLQAHVKWLKHELPSQKGDKAVVTRRRLSMYETVIFPLDPPGRHEVDINPTWESFWRRHFLKRAAVPEHLKEWAENGIDRLLGHTALHQATWMNFVGAVEYLLKEGANTKLRMTVKPFYTPLELAKEENRKDVVKLLEKMDDCTGAWAPVSQSSAAHSWETTVLFA